MRQALARRVGARHRGQRAAARRRSLRQPLAHLGLEGRATPRAENSSAAVNCGSPVRLPVRLPVRFHCLWSYAVLVSVPCLIPRLAQGGGGGIEFPHVAEARRR